MGIEKLRIVHLYPKELNLYGDNGNLLCLKRRIEQRSIKTEIREVGIGELIPDFDIMVIGGGQDREMGIISSDLKRKSEMLSYCVKSGKVVFSVCAGFQLLGEYYKTADGKIIKLTCALPFYTVAGENRKIGNIITSTPFGKIAGFENHSGITHLSEKLSPLGKVISGFGNDGKAEGVLFCNTFATYLHGPVLPKNPSLADEIIKRALKTDELSALDDGLENKCHSYLVKRFSR